MDFMFLEQIKKNYMIKIYLKWNMLNINQIIHK